MRYRAFFIVFLCLIACEKDKDAEIQTKASFEATINGERVSIVESDSLIDVDTYIDWNPSLIIETGYYDNDVFRNIYVFGLNLGKLVIDFTPKNKISINFINHLSRYDLDENEKIPKTLFENILSKGIKSFSTNYKTEPGILIEYYDLNCNKWTSAERFLSGSSTIPVSPDFSNNSFKINKSENIDPIYPMYKYSQYLEISFKCNLYSLNGDSISIIDAIFKGIYSINNQY